MYILYIFLFGISLLLITICAIIFKKYKQNYVTALPREQLPIIFLSGISALMMDLLYKFPLPGKRSIITVRFCSYIIMTFIACMSLGLLYTCSLLFNQDDTVTSLIRPNAGEGSSTISLITDSDLYSGTIDISVDEKKYSFEEATELFSSYRHELDAYVLYNNESFLNVTSPLRFPSSLGDEGIAISWNIEDTNIINYSGELVLENISLEGSETNIIATLTLGDICAEIVYYIIAYPPELTSAELLTDYIHTYINSENNIYSEHVTLPTDIDGVNLSFYSKNSVFPSVGVHYSSRLPIASNYCI